MQRLKLTGRLFLILLSAALAGWLFLWALTFKASAAPAVPGRQPHTALQGSGALCTDLGIDATSFPEADFDNQNTQCGLAYPKGGKLPPGSTDEFYRYHDGAFYINKTSSPGEAQSWVQADIARSQGAVFTSTVSTFGEMGYYSSDGAGRYNLVFQRDCYYVSGGWGPPTGLDWPVDEATKTQVTKDLRKVDDLLKEVGCGAQNFRLTITNLNHDPAHPESYEPFSFEISLEQRASNGDYSPMKHEPIYISALEALNSLSDSFLVSDCPQCEFKAYKGRQFARYKLSAPDPTVKNSVVSGYVLQEIPLRTDSNGKALITFFLDIPRLTKSHSFPTSAVPLVNHFQVIYRRQGQNGLEKLAEKQFEVSLEGVGIVEKINLTYPTLLDPINSKDRPESEKTIDLASYTADPGIRDGTDLVQGTARVKQTLNIWWIETPRPMKRINLAVGAFIHTYDDLSLNACGLPKPYPQQGEKAALAVQLRYFDGVRIQAAVKESVCIDEFTIAKAYQESTGQENPIFTYFSSKLKDEITDRFLEKGIEIVAVRLVPLYQAVQALNTAVEYVEKLRGETVYLQLNSAVYLEAAIGGGVRITTREGSPRLYTPAAPGGVEISPGQSATLDGSLQAVLAVSSAEVSGRADALLKTIDPQYGPASGVISLPPVDLNLVLVGISLCSGLLVLVVVGIGLRWLLSNRQAGQPTSPLPVSPPANPTLPEPPSSASPAQPPPEKPRQPVPSVWTSAPPPQSNRRASFLKLLNQAGNNPLIELSPEGFTLGRDAKNSLGLFDDQISRVHARIDWGQERWLITDLNSANGTFVNNVRVRIQELHDGDVIRLGRTELVFLENPRLAA